MHASPSSSTEIGMGHCDSDGHSAQMYRSPEPAFSPSEPMSAEKSEPKKKGDKSKITKSRDVGE